MATHGPLARMPTTWTEARLSARSESRDGRIEFLRARRQHVNVAGRARGVDDRDRASSMRRIVQGAVSSRSTRPRNSKSPDASHLAGMPLVEGAERILPNVHEEPYFLATAAFGAPRAPGRIVFSAGRRVAGRAAGATTAAPFRQAAEGRRAMQSVPSAFREEPASPEHTRCFQLAPIGIRQVRASTAGRERSSERRCSRNGARRQALPRERGAGSVASHSAERLTGHQRLDAIT